MRKIRQLTLLLATIASMFTLAVVPVAAEGGSGDSGSSGSGSSTTETKETETEPPAAADNNSATELETEREHGSQLLADMRQHGGLHSKELRQKACEQRQENLDKRVGNFSDNAARHLAVFDGLFTKVQAFVTDKSLTVPNYDTLVATVKDKQTAATASVAALKALDVKVDCTQPDPAQALATIKAAVADARTALQAYRAALKDLVVAIKGASTAHDNETENSTAGGNQ